MDRETMQARALEQLNWMHDQAKLRWGQIAGLLDVPPATVSRWVSKDPEAHRAPSPLACRAIANLYDEVKANYSPKVIAVKPRAA